MAKSIYQGAKDIRISRVLSRGKDQELVNYWADFVKRVKIIANNPKAIDMYLNPQGFYVYLTKQPRQVAQMSANQY